MAALHVRCTALHKSGVRRGRLGSAEAPTGNQPTPPQSQSQSGIWPCLAEGEGFEPSKRLTTLNGFRDRPVQPLRHPSRCGQERLAAPRWAPVPCRYA